MGNLWYAVQMNSADPWDNGSFDLEEAKDIAHDLGATIIAVIDTDTDSCISEYHKVDGYWQEWDA